MANPYFSFKQFTVRHDRCAMKVTTDSCLFGAWVARELQQLSGIQDIWDIGTGSGLLSLMVAQKNNVVIDAIEIDPAAAAQASENSSASPWSENIRIIHEDVRTADPGKKYDAIISNPPFYERELPPATTEKKIAHHSRELKLDQLLALIATHLKPGGKFFLLLPYKRKDEMVQRIRKQKLFIEKMVEVHQSVAHTPFRLMISGGFEEIRTRTASLAIKDERQQYTNEFTELLRDYYLYL